MKATRIETYFGPEDIVRDPMRENRLIISCCLRTGRKPTKGCIQYLDIDTSSGKPKARDYELAGYAVGSLSPHGIFARNLGEKSYLYVISHESSDKIIQFRIEGNTLTHVKSHSSDAMPLLKGANDLFVTDTGEIFFTATRSNIRAFAGFRRSIVGSISTVGKYRVVVNQLRYANGVYVLNDIMYVTDTLTDQLLSFDLRASDIWNSKKFLCEVKGGDNISMWGDSLIIAGHPKMGRFYVHAIRNKSRSPTTVTAYDMASGSSREIYHSDGEEISGGSIALFAGQHLYIGQVFKNYVLRVEQTNAQE